LYAQARAAQAAGDWPGARSALDDLVAQAPGYKDAAALLETAKVQAQLADLYAQARQLHGAGRWQAALNVFARIAALDPDYADPEGLLPSAKEEITAQAGRAELQDLYRRAVLAVDAGQWAEARELLVQVQAREPGYRETGRLLARVESELERQAAEQQRAVAEQRRQEQVAACTAKRSSSCTRGAGRPRWPRWLRSARWMPSSATQRASRRSLVKPGSGRGAEAAPASGEPAPGSRAAPAEQVAALYEQAHQQARAGHWQQVVAKVQEIKSLDLSSPTRMGSPPRRKRR